MKLKKIAALIMSTVMVTTFTACRNDSGKEKGADGDKTITFWSKSTVRLYWMMG